MKVDKNSTKPPASRQPSRPGLAPLNLERHEGNMDAEIDAFFAQLARPSAAVRWLEASVAGLVRPVSRQLVNRGAQMLAKRRNLVEQRDLHRDIFAEQVHKMLLEQHLHAHAAAHRRLRVLFDIAGEHGPLLQQILHCKLESPDGVGGTAYELALHYNDFATARLLAQSDTFGRRAACNGQQLLAAVGLHPWPL